MQSALPRAATPELSEGAAWEGRCALSLSPCLWGHSAQTPEMHSSKLVAPWASSTVHRHSSRGLLCLDPTPALYVGTEGLLRSGEFAVAAVGGVGSMQGSEVPAQAGLLVADASCPQSPAAPPPGKLDPGGLRRRLDRANKCVLNERSQSLV